MYIRKVREYCRLYNPSLVIVDTFSRYKVVILRGRDCFIHETEKQWISGNPKQRPTTKQEIL